MSGVSLVPTRYFPPPPSIVAVTSLLASGLSRTLFPSSSSFPSALSSFDHCLMQAVSALGSCGQSWLDSAMTFSVLGCLPVEGALWLMTYVDNFNRARSE